MRNRENGFSFVNAVSNIINSNSNLPTTDRELMDIGTISALVRDGQAPQRVENPEHPHTFAVGPKEITLTENQAMLVSEAVDVELYRERDREFLSKFGL